MTEGFLYEPRSLWSIANIQATALPQIVQLDKRHFFNGERYPITITRVTMAAINYLLVNTVQTGAPLAANVGANESSAVINRLRVSIAVPQRYHLNTKRRVLVAAAAPEPRFMPPTVLTAGVTPTDYVPSSLWGQCHLDFDKPLIIPRTGTLEWDLSAYTPFPNNTTGGGNDQSAPVFATMLWQEEGGLLPGSARTRRVALQPYTGDLSQADPLEKWPYPVDGYGLGVALAAAGTPSVDWWGGQSRFPAAGGANQGAPFTPATPQGSFASQESTRAGSTRLLGMRTHIDQIAYDADLATNGFDGVPQASPLSLRTGCRVRSINGGSGAWWWRPGAPMALVLDTITPASVFKLPEPVTLGPGEQLDVEMEFPANIPDFATTFHVGIAFNGYAAIEG